MFHENHVLVLHRKFHVQIVDWFGRSSLLFSWTTQFSNIKSVFKFLSFKINNQYGQPVHITVFDRHDL